MIERERLRQTEVVREAGEFIVTRTMHPARGRLPVHGHANAYFCFVLEGSFSESGDDGTHECVAGTMVFHPRHDLHSDNFGSAMTRCLNIDVPAAWEETMCSYASVFAMRGDRRSVRTTAIARNINAELCRRDALAGVAIHGLVLELAAEWSRSAGPSTRRQPAWLSEATEVVRREFNRSIEFAAIARRLAVHPVQLSREFRRAHGVTMSGFVAQLRIAYASQLMTTTTMPLSQIALSAGFADQSHMARTFRRIDGRTCTQVRSGVKPGQAFI